MSAVAPKMPGQADINFEAFQELLPKLLETQAGKFALMHDREIVACFDTLADAAKFGTEKFGDANFSVQEITSKNVNLGFYSYAVHHTAA